MKPLIVSCILSCFCLGCDGVQVDTAPPIAKLVKSIPSTDETVNIRDTITLEFTAVPENLKISVPLSSIVRQDINYLPLPLDYTNPDKKHSQFYIRSFEYNGNTRPRFVISSRWGIIKKDRTYPVHVIVQWTHGYKILNFDVKKGENR